MIRACRYAARRAKMMLCTAAGVGSALRSAARVVVFSHAMQKSVAKTGQVALRHATATMLMRVCRER